MSLSSRQAPVSEELRAAVATAVRNLAGTGRPAGERFPPTKCIGAGWRSIDWRLQASGQLRSEHAPLPRAAYGSSAELAEDVRILQRQLVGVAQRCAWFEGEIQRWLDQIEVFGLHLARLDVRQDARYYEAVMTELLARAGLAADFAALPEADRQRVLLETLGRPPELGLDRRCPTRRGKRWR